MQQPPGLAGDFASAGAAVACNAGLADALLAARARRQQQRTTAGGVSATNSSSSASGGAPGQAATSVQSVLPQTKAAGSLQDLAAVPGKSAAGSGPAKPVAADLLARLAAAKRRASATAAAPALARSTQPHVGVGAAAASAAAAGHHGLGRMSPPLAILQTAAAAAQPQASVRVPVAPSGPAVLSAAAAEGLEADRWSSHPVLEPTSARCSAARQSPQLLPVQQPAADVLPPAGVASAFGVAPEASRAQQQQQQQQHGAPGAASPVAFGRTALADEQCVTVHAGHQGRPSALLSQQQHPGRQALRALAGAGQVSPVASPKPEAQHLPPAARGPTRQRQRELADTPPAFQATQPASPVALAPGPAGGAAELAAANGAMSAAAAATSPAPQLPVQQSTAALAAVVAVTPATAARITSPICPATEPAGAAVHCVFS
jgi:hypothetical protein